MWERVINTIPLPEVAGAMVDAVGKRVDLIPVIADTGFTANKILKMFNTLTTNHILLNIYIWQDMLHN